MILIALSHESNVPLYKQVYKQLTDMIQLGTLLEGDQLPSTRALADQLHVNRTTITRAYEELWATGYLESRSGSYSYVRRRSPLVTANHSNDTNLINWHNIADKTCDELHVDFHHHKLAKCPPGGFDFRTLSPDSRLMPIDEFRKSINHVIKSQGAKLFGYGHASGYYPLRSLVSKQMALHGMAVSAEDVIITNGAQEAISLLVQLLAHSGKKIAIEAPTYSAAIPLFKLSSSKIINIPMTKVGMDLDVLEHHLKKGDMAFVYTIPNFHNPTGITTPQSHREQLIQLCETYHVPLLEDGFEEEMKYMGKQIMPIKSMDTKGIVIYLGTFSKILFPGLRIGWIAAPKACINLLESLKHARHIADDHLKQAALVHFCQQGQFEKHIKRMHRIYRKRMQIALKTLRDQLINEHIRYTKPLGGYTIWFTINRSNLDEEQVFLYLQKNKILVSPGSHYYSGDHQDLSFRISIAQRNESEVQNGISALCSALNQMLTQ